MGFSESLGAFEQLVLMALIRLPGDAYGVRIVDEIAARTGREPSVGAVYTTLQRLEMKGYVRSRMGEPTPERGGKAKKYFRITAVGQRALERSVSGLLALLPPSLARGGTA